MPGTAAEHIVLKRGDVAADFAFLDRLIRSGLVRKLYDDHDFDDAGIGRYDLDGDGQYELLVGIAGNAFCHREPCSVFLYRLWQGQWHWIGEMQVAYESSWANYEVIVESQRHDGWRILSDGEYWKCWIGRFHARRDYQTKDQFGIPRHPEGGYFRRVKRGEPCPDD
ncbi:MAG: hypothetical protein FJX46_14985 [Alphaproteobacteria bacterium]|nr:hypothetical protein [Alphaproteobacteria bacterium]